MNIMLQRDSSILDNSVELIYNTYNEQSYFGLPDQGWCDKYFIELGPGEIEYFRNANIGTKIDNYILIAKWED